MDKYEKAKVIINNLIKHGVIAESSCQNTYIKAWDACINSINELHDKDESPWISVEDAPINGSNGWSKGDKAIGWNGYAFEIEWDGDFWCSIAGDDPTHWMPLPKPPTGEK